MLSFICLAFAVFLLWQGTAVSGQAAMLVRNASILLTDPLALPAVEQMREQEQAEEEPVAFAAWREERNQNLKAENTGKSAWTNLLWISGSSELLLPCGKNLGEGDEEGCLIDLETARELFGSEQVEGMTVLANGKEKVVRGVFTSPKRLVILSGLPDGETAGFSRITLSCMRGQSQKALGEDFLVRHGISGEVLRWDLTQGLSWLGELVPGKWSDFQGWSDNGKEKIQEGKLIARVEKGTLELEYLAQQKRGFFTTLTGGLILWALLARLLALAGRKARIWEVRWSRGE